MIWSCGESADSQAKAILEGMDESKRGKLDQKKLDGLHH